ncbi:MAG: hypothetical protein IRZ03_13165 [Acidobacterium ailaaui]|nr:hypothetical protein [Pseudacidobacterium ailaaui]
MAENYLKKEFTKRAVTRIRNILEGKYNDPTVTQIGYDKLEDKPIIGKIYNKDGYEYQVNEKYMIKKRKIKNYGKIPLFCPKCGNVMKNDNVTISLYKIHGMCIDCVTEEETKLKAEGKWEEYEKEMIKRNVETTKKMLYEFFEYMKNYDEDVYIDQQGFRQNWHGHTTNNILKKIKDDINDIENIKL